jgi:2'-hydroxyisoflavone reductase
MRVLVIGGTRFVGWHTVTELLAHGHEVTLLNRARSEPDEWPGLTRIVTDRRAPDSRALRSLARSWDLVIDCCAYTPGDLAITGLLRTRTRHYTLISTYSVHDPYSASDKRHTERAARRLLSGVPLLILRLGLTVGPRDPTGRLSYWIERGLAGGDTLVPLQREQPLRLIDVRDVATITAQAAVTGITGFLDVVGPSITADALLKAIAQITGNRVRWRWIPEDDALAEGLRPWTQIPLWIPTTDTAARTLMTRHPDTRGAEIRCRTLRRTLADCLAWHLSNRFPRPEWLTPAAEQELLHRHRLAESP